MTQLCKISAAIERENKKAKLNLQTRDPRDPHEVLIQEGIEPHPGPNKVSQTRNGKLTPLRPGKSIMRRIRWPALASLLWLMAPQAEGATTTIEYGNLNSLACTSKKPCDASRLGMPFLTAVHSAVSQEPSNLTCTCAEGTRKGPIGWCDRNTSFDSKKTCDASRLDRPFLTAVHCAVSQTYHLSTLIIAFLLVLILRHLSTAGGYRCVKRRRRPEASDIASQPRQNHEIPGFNYRWKTKVIAAKRISQRQPRLVDKKLKWIQRLARMLKKIAHADEKCSTTSREQNPGGREERKQQKETIERTSLSRPSEVKSLQRALLLIMSNWTIAKAAEST